MNELADLYAAMDDWANVARHTVLFGRPKSAALTCLVAYPDRGISRRSVVLAIDFAAYPPGTEAQLRELLGLEGEDDGDRSVSAANAPRRWSVRPKT